jgi:hypothetical protein
MVESVPDGPATWLHATDSRPLIKPNFDHAVYLIRRYMLATNCVLDLFNESDLFGNLPAWLENDSEQIQAFSPIYYLVVAIGVQTCPEEKESLANLYFDHGRYLIASCIIEDPSIETV